MNGRTSPQRVFVILTAHPWGTPHTIEGVWGGRGGVGEGPATADYTPEQHDERLLPPAGLVHGGAPCRRAHAVC